MLESFYDHPALYDLEYFDALREDVPHYVRLAASAGRALELGCGTGRLTLPMARAGASVVGVDRAPPMLQRLRQRLGAEPRLDVRVVEGDFHGLELGERFPLVVLPFNAVHHVMQAEQLLALFERVTRHLEPGGRFALDLIVPDPRFWQRSPDGVHEVRWFQDPDGGRMKTWENGEYDPISQVNHVRYHYRRADGRRQSVEVPMRIWYPQEFLALVRLGGFTVRSMTGDFEGRPLTARSGKMVLVLGTEA